MAMNGFRERQVIRGAGEGEGEGEGDAHGKERPSFEERQKMAVKDREMAEERARREAVRWGWGDRQIEERNGPRDGAECGDEVGTSGVVSEHKAMRLPSTYFVCDHANPLNQEARIAVWSRPPPSRAQLGTAPSCVCLTM